MRSKLLLLILLLSLPLTLAFSEQPYHLSLLAVQESEDGYEGSTADLYLELREGSGRVFLETKPLTKMDTQISTRFAKEIACKHFKLNCDKYDFIYTIKAESNIIGGPSAGAALAALTTIAVLDLKHDDNIAITGTINSGGIIGPVGGVKEKLAAAQQFGLKKVLVAKGTISQQLESEENQTELVNQTLKEYAEQELDLPVIEVMDLDEVIYELTGKQLNHQEYTITENEEYNQIMQNLQQVLCERTAKIKSELKSEDLILDDNTSIELKERELNAQQAAELGDYYSAASFCFSNNIMLKNEYYAQKEPSLRALNNLFSILEKKMEQLRTELEQEEIETISDLQALMVVQERLNDAQDNINQYYELRTEPFDDQQQYYLLLAYAEERYFSAVSWKQFFNMDGQKFMLDKERLKNSCQEKIAEAEERHQYVSLFINLLPIVNIQEKVDAANLALENEEYELCLIMASQAKADANAILSSMGLDDNNLQDFIDSKSKAAERVMAENIADGIFPILGYSYYQYANTLRADEPYTALIYLEYSLEMSELSIYFPEEKNFFELGFQLREKWVYGLAGLVIGVVVAFGMTFLLMRKKGKKKKIKLKSN